MDNTILLNGISADIRSAELHLPACDGFRRMYLLVTAEPRTEFALWDVDLLLLADINDLDGKRIHVRGDGETFEDDTLGTDILPLNDGTGWYSTQGDYLFSELQMDFKRLEGCTYRCKVQCLLTDADEEAEKPGWGLGGIPAYAEFVVDVDEANPMDW